MACRCAPALLALRNEVNTVWPARDHASDGCCGDADHAARKSDHNPDADGWAHAFDIDEDLAPGLDLAWLWARWVKDPEPRIKYLIYERRIFYTSTRDIDTYTGANAHEHHLHVSIKATATHDTSPWGITPTDPVLAPPTSLGGDVLRYSHLDGAPGELAVDQLLLRPSGALWGASKDGHGLYAWGSADPALAAADAPWRAAFHDQPGRTLVALRHVPTHPDLVPDPGPFGVVLVRDDGAEYSLVQTKPAGGDPCVGTRAELLAANGKLSEVRTGLGTILAGLG